MAKRVIAFMCALVLGLSVSAPAFVHASEEPYASDFASLSLDQLKGLTALANMQTLGMEVKSSSTWDTIEDFLSDFGSWTWDTIDKAGERIKDAVFWTGDQIDSLLGLNQENSFLAAPVRTDIPFNASTVRGLLGNRIAKRSLRHSLQPVT